jgi:hypothetical protein
MKSPRKVLEVKGLVLVFLKVEDSWKRIKAYGYSIGLTAHFIVTAAEWVIVSYS